MKWGDIPNWSGASVASLLQVLKHIEPGTYEHCLRVGEYSKQLALYAGMNEYQQRVAEIAGMLHDIGKASIDLDILLKPGKLNAIEYEIIKSHSLASEEFIKPLSEAHQFFKDVQPIVRAHHEFINGTGYPDKKVGDEIPILARIVSVVDTYDAMAVTRTYRAGLTDDIIYAELKRCAGTQFDSQLATIFLNSHRFWKKSQASEETQHEILKKVG